MAEAEAEAEVAVVEVADIEVGVGAEEAELAGFEVAEVRAVELGGVRCRRLEVAVAVGMEVRWGWAEARWEWGAVE